MHRGVPPALGGAGADVVAGRDVDSVEADARTGGEHFIPVVGVDWEEVVVCGDYTFFELFLFFVGGGGVGWGRRGGCGERGAVDFADPVPEHGFVGCCADVVPEALFGGDEVCEGFADLRASCEGGEVGDCEAAEDVEEEFGWEGRERGGDGGFFGWWDGLDREVGEGGDERGDLF